MNNNKKKILAIVLVVVVLLLGGASIYVATQLSTRKSVAPTAPESKPAAAGVIEECGDHLICSEAQTTGSSKCTDGIHLDGWWCCPLGMTISNGMCVEFVWNEGGKCTATGSATALACVPDGTVTCSTDCPTECGKPASTITTCTDSCGVAATKSCPATDACAPEQAVLEGEKKAFKNVTTNTPGKYTLSTEMSTVSKSQIYVYSINITNTSDATATGVVLKDSLKDLTELTFMDTVSGCSWSAANVELTCTTTLNPAETKTFSFRVKASDAIINGDVITNTANVTAENANSLTLTKDLTVSTVVSCNHTCTTDEECSNGLKCDTTTGKCRSSVCLTEEDCTCPVAQSTITATATKAPTATKTAAPTRIASAAATPTVLPETGILDFPGVAAFGGGLFLAIIGILLAL